MPRIEATDRSASNTSRTHISSPSRCQTARNRRSRAQTSRKRN